MAYYGSYFFCLPGFREQVEEILLRKAHYMNGVCPNVNIHVLKEYKTSKNLNILKSFILKLPVISFKGGFQRANDMMEKESCKVFRIFPNCGTCFKKRIFSIVPFLVISNGNSSCFQINTKRYDSGTKTLPAA